MPRKMPKSIQSWLIPRLRRISMYWPGKTIARDQAKIRLEVGKFKNGKPKFRTFWKCANCKGLFNRDETQMDHINPVIELKGFKDWNTTIPALLANPEGYQCLCIKCHEKKTSKENKIRDKLKK
jgi:5-methylcytosine-specific restriction endonuclease McrA